MSVLDRLETVEVSLAEPTEESRATSWSVGRARYRAVAVVSDLVVALAIFIAFGTYVSAPTWAMGIGAAAAYVGLVALAGGYEARHLTIGRGELRAIGKAALVLLVLAMGLAFFGVATVPTGPALLAVGGMAGASVLLRTAQRKVLTSAHADGAWRPRALVVADGERAGTIVRDLTVAYPQLELVGAAVTDAEIGHEVANGVVVAGPAEDAAELAHALAVDTVVVAAGAVGADRMRQLRWALEKDDTELMMMPDVAEVMPNRLDVHTAGATPVLDIKLQPGRGHRVVKAIMDRVLGSILLVIASPVLAVAMIAIRLDSRGPALFRQVRVGQDGRPFTMVKLRTMVVDAEQRREELVEQSTGAGPLFKMELDPRVTKVGRVLRRFSLDELPQLWNVVRGDMSLVGPRPPLPSEVATYDSMAVHRLHVKPGLTGLWQVSGRSDLSWEESVRLDLRYVDNWSIGFDLQILWRTVAAVLGARGAY